MAEPTAAAAKSRGNVILGPVEPGASPIYVKGPASRRYLTWYTLLTLAVTAIWGSVAGILLPNHVQILEFARWFTGPDSGVDLQQLTTLQQAIDAGTATATADQLRQLKILADFNASRAQSLSIITSVGVGLTMLIQPLVGVASDRTRTALGRRSPWILFGTVVGSLLLASLRIASTVLMIAVIYMLAQAVLNTAMGPLAASVADRMPEDRRGTASALGGFGSFSGGVAGAVLAGALFASLGLNLYFLFAAFAAFAGVMFAIFARDYSSKDLAVSRFNWKEFGVGFTIALRSRNFRWVLVARTLLTSGYAVSTALGLYMMQSYIHPAMTVADATKTAPLLSLAGIPFWVIVILVAGNLSDKLKKRRVFVIAASILMAVAMLVPMVWPALPALFIQAILSGIALGTYLPVDQALFIDVLPDSRAAGRDLGVAALGSNLGQALGPILAGVVVSATGGYFGVWAAALVLALVAAVAVLPLKGVI